MGPAPEGESKKWIEGWGGGSAKSQWHNRRTLVRRSDSMFTARHGLTYDIGETEMQLLLYLDRE